MYGEDSDEEAEEEAEEELEASGTEASAGSTHEACSHAGHSCCKIHPNWRIFILCSAPNIKSNGRLIVAIHPFSRRCQMRRYHQQAMGRGRAARLLRQGKYAAKEQLQRG